MQEELIELEKDWDKGWKDWDSHEDKKWRDDRRDRRIQWTLEKMSHRDIKTVIETGAGPGWHTKLLKDAGYEVIGTDISLVAVEMGKGQFPDIDLRQLSIEDTPQLPEADAILCMATLNVVLDDAAAIDVLSKSGRWGYFSFQDYANHHQHLRFYNLEKIGRLLKPYAITNIEKIPDFWMVEVDFKYDYPLEDPLFKRISREEISEQEERELKEAWQKYNDKT